MLIVASDGQRALYEIAICGHCLGERCEYHPDGPPVDVFGPTYPSDLWPERQVSTPVVEPEPVPEAVPARVPEPDIAADRRRSQAAAVEPKRKVVDLKPPVDPDTERAAKVIAEQVRMALVMSRAELYQGRSAESVDRYLAHAVAMEWVVAGPELIKPGGVDHRPVQPIGDVDGPSWGPEEAVGLFRTAPARLG